MTIDDTVPSIFKAGFVHRAKVRCYSCGGQGTVQGYPCGICCVHEGGVPKPGAGDVSVGCGGEAEIDMHYGTAYCKGCGRFVPREEVT
jgi:hypothetical protein